ncbi:MAG: U32 family peptidase [Bacteroidales bacterium]|nr:U32 family peptidase [Bacteroidales bacterium]
MKQRAIELLSPARNLSCGIDAINHGADAVYIGAPLFSARAAAGNSIEEIESLCNYAHKYFGRVYVALNTILKEQELAEAETIIHRLYNAGADALIIQDMGILQMNLPPIALHASTQMDNRTPEKVSFLEKTGFTQVVLARELSLDQISAISKSTSVSLEAFVHGSLCVSYSGQCYASQALTGRSANRGECAQICRLPFTLTDAEGKEICKEKHLLSLKDLNHSSHLEELIDAGISSLKIEGRLKDNTYVKNVTAFYRQQLDLILEKRASDYIPASSGKTTFFFTPQPEKSFNRGFTSYFLYGREPDICSPDTPKSIGEKIGTVKYATPGKITVNSSLTLHNGDGFCYLESGTFKGFRINRAEGNTLYPSEKFAIEKGTTLYRNQDQEFEQLLTRNTAERKVSVEITLLDDEEGFKMLIQDKDGTSYTKALIRTKELAKQDQTAQIQRVISKLGDTIYTASAIHIKLSQPYFIPSSILTEFRRQVFSEFEEKRIKRSLESRSISQITQGIPFPSTKLTYLGNVSNSKANAFYKATGVSDIAAAYELEPVSGASVMFCKHCILYTLNMCKKRTPGSLSGWKEPFILSSKNHKLALKFDCVKCEMKLIPIQE